MEFVLFIAFLIAFFGYGVGILLHYMTENEVEQGKTYLLLSREVLVLLLFFLALSLFDIKESAWVVAGIVAGFFFPGTTYFPLGFLALLAVLLHSPFLLLSLIFLYGITEGSLVKKKKWEIIKQTLFQCSLFAIGITLSLLISEKSFSLAPFILSLLFGSFLSTLAHWEQGKLFKS